jgi:hypothetical protein
MGRFKIGLKDFVPLDCINRVYDAIYAFDVSLHRFDHHIILEVDGNHLASNHMVGKDRGQLRLVCQQCFYLILWYLFASPEPRCSWH